MEETGYLTSSSIRRCHKSIVDAGLMPTLLKAMDQSARIKKVTETQKDHNAPNRAEIPEHVLYYYDEMVKMLQRPSGEQYNIKEFLTILNENSPNLKNHKPMTRTRFYYYVERIEQLGIRDDSLSVLMKNKKRSPIHGTRNEQMDEYIKLANRYDELYRELRSENKPVSKNDVYKILAVENNVSADRISRRINQARTHLKTFNK